MCSERHDREKQKMKLDVYEVYCITHREAKGLHFYKRKRERAHSNKVLWTERNRKNKQIHILPGAKVRGKNDRERKRAKWVKNENEMVKDFLLWQIIFKTKQREEVNKRKY